MQVAGRMLLNDELQFLPVARVTTFRLSRLGEIPLAPVLRELGLRTGGRFRALGGRGTRGAGPRLRDLLGHQALFGCRWKTRRSSTFAWSSIRLRSGLSFFPERLI